MQVPILPVLVGMICQHIETFGMAPDGRLFKIYRDGIYLPSTLRRVQQAGREEVSIKLRRPRRWRTGPMASGRRVSPMRGISSICGG